jgi:septal ring factor EnvC (AmiA/AmiB activator)
VTEVTNELMYELLKRLQQDIGDVKQVQRDHTAEFISIRRHLAATDAKIAALEGDIADIRDVVRRMDARIARIERRLDIVDEPVI